jgi:hypothetical protein
MAPRMRAVRVGCLVFVVLVVSVALVGHASARARRPAGSLIVSVQGLPRGVAARVRVTGPAGFVRLVTRSGSRLSALKLGRYAVVVLPTTGDGINWSASSHRRMTVLVAARVKRVSVAYTLGVRAGTVAVSASAVRGAELSAHGATLLLSREATRRLRRGNYLTVGITKHTPQGFLGLVRSVTRGRRGVTVDATRVSLGRLLPEATLTVVIPATHASASSLRVFGTNRRAAADGFADGVSCSDGAKLTLTGQADANIGLHISIIHHLLSFTRSSAPKSKLAPTRAPR